MENGTSYNIVDGDTKNDASSSPTSTGCTTVHCVTYRWSALFGVKLLCGEYVPDLCCG